MVCENIPAPRVVGSSRVKRGAVSQATLSAPCDHVIAAQATTQIPLEFDQNIHIDQGLIFSQIGIPDAAVSGAALNRR